jgi:hypothetical protein
MEPTLEQRIDRLERLADAHTWAIVEIASRSWSLVGTDLIRKIIEITREASEITSPAGQVAADGEGE